MAKKENIMTIQKRKNRQLQRNTKITVNQYTVKQYRKEKYLKNRISKITCQNTK